MASEAAFSGVDGVLPEAGEDWGRLLLVSVPWLGSSIMDLHAEGFCTLGSAVSLW